MYIKSLNHSISGMLVNHCKVTMEGPIIWDQIEDDKYLLCDHRGLISLLVVESDRIRCSTLGRVESTSVIRYIDNRVIYTGSYSGPSHLLRILSNRLEPIIIVVLSLIWWLWKEAQKRRCSC